jgi:hypothetical protein
MSTSENIIINEDIKSEPQNNNIIINLDNQKNDSFNKLFSIQNLILKQAGLKDLCKKYFYKIN